MTPIVDSLEKNKENIDALLKNCMDIIRQEITLGQGKVLLVYVEITAGSVLMDQSVVACVLKMLANMDEKLWKEKIEENGLGVARSKQFTDLENAIAAMLTGDVLLVVDGCTTAITLADKGYPGKPVGNCEAEKVLRGSSEGFCDSVKTNEALVRKRIRSTDLKIVEKKLGVRSNTTVSMLYMHSLVPHTFLQQLNSGLDRYSIDGIFDSGTLEQLLERDWASPFPQFQSTQRPDRVALELLEGKVVLLSDNSPSALILPACFSDYLQVSEDRYNRFETVGLERLIRYGAMLLTIYISALYLSVISFHTQLLPIALLTSIAQSRQEVPFIPLIEVLMLEIAFELIREAGVRMPGPLSGTIGIVGGLIIGDAAVAANLVSPMSVIVVAGSALCSFAVPDEEFGAALRLVRFMMLLLSGLLGLGGVVCGSFWLLLHLCNLESFGIPYVQVVHKATKNMQDTVIRDPLYRLDKRPYFVHKEQTIRLRKNKKRKEAYDEQKK